VFESVALLEEAMVLAVPPRHSLASSRGRRVSLTELADEQFLLLKDGHCFRDDVLQLCERCHMTPNVVFEGGQFDTLVAMVAAGAGVTLLPEMARRHYRHAGIRLVEFARPRPARALSLVRVKDKFVSPAVQAFADYLGAECDSVCAESVRATASDDARRNGRGKEQARGASCGA
jgi:LysR family transcriptional regulator, hydrogen peroxide-inducible genes activator